MQKFERIEQIEMEMDRVDERIDKLHRTGVVDKDKDMAVMRNLIAMRDELFNELCRLGQAV